MGKKLRIGLLGAGRIGNLHGTNIQNFVPDAEVVIVADPFMNEKMEEWAKSIGIARCTKDPEDVFKADDVDAVFICSSTNTHADFMIRYISVNPIGPRITKSKEKTKEIIKRTNKSGLARKKPIMFVITTVSK